MEILENKEICAKCGGRCCKKSGCDYAPKDFKNLSIDYLQSKLEEGNISIACTLFFDKLKNGKITCIPFLHLRARNKNRPIVDLLSMKTSCSLLQDDGCPYDYENRPTGAKNVIPTPDYNCPSKEKLDDLIIEPWKQYQKTLSRLVRRLTGFSVDEKLSMDVEKLYNEILNENFENVSKAGLEEMRELMPLLAIVYEEEFRKVFKNLDIFGIPMLLKSIDKYL